MKDWCEITDANGIIWHIWMGEGEDAGIEFKKVIGCVHTHMAHGPWEERDLCHTEAEKKGIKY